MLTEGESHKRARFWAIIAENKPPWIYPLINDWIFYSTQGEAIPPSYFELLPLIVVSGEISRTMKPGSKGLMFLVFRNDCHFWCLGRSLLCALFGFILYMTAVWMICVDALWPSDTIWPFTKCLLKKKQEESPWLCFIHLLFRIWKDDLNKALAVIHVLNC